MMLVYAIALSMALHFALLYTPLLQSIFGIVPLGWSEWAIVVGWSVPILFIDEGLKFVERGWFMPTADLRREKVD